jgi:predicted Rossmann fold flavoprotein
MEQQREQDVPPIVVVGAGAAGLMAAIFAASGQSPGFAGAAGNAVGGESGGRASGSSRGHIGISPARNVLLLERTRDGGRKILISGGGRCNVLPSAIDPSRYVTTSSQNIMRRLLRSWPLAEQRRFFEEEVGIRLALEPETGKFFPVSNRAREVRDRLVALAERRGVATRFDSAMVGLIPPAGDLPWQVLLEGGEILPASAVILATGGLSVPQTGSDGTGLRVVDRLGHTIHETYPALTPLTAVPPRHADLAGVSLEVTLQAPLKKGRFTTHGGFLFTHRGYSGPAALNISHLAVLSRLHGGPRQPILAQWTDLDDEGWDSLLRTPPGQVGAQLRRRLPQRLADALLAEAGLDPALSLAQLRREDRVRLVELLASYPLPWTGDEGYKKAEVTGGGVDLAEIDPRTMESRIHPGLFLCGEILDTFGPIGGYNFFWAWATGRAAGQGAAARG